MGFRIAPPDDSRQPAKTKPVKRKSYRDFIKSLPCILSWEYGVECCHVNYSNKALGAPGRGKSQKADDRWTLPMNPSIHREQHNYTANSKYVTGEKAFWQNYRVNPHVACLVLWGLWTENPHTAEQRATELIMSNKLGET